MFSHRKNSIQRNGICVAGSCMNYGVFNSMSSSLLQCVEGGRNDDYIKNLRLRAV